MLSHCTNCGEIYCWGDCYALTQGTSAGTAETGTGSGRQPAGPTPIGDAPETSSSGDPKCPKK